MVGNESLAGILRILTCYELFQNCKCYSSYPYFDEFWGKPNFMFVEKDSMFTVSLSDKAGVKYFHCKNKEETIQYDTSVMCEPGASSSFMCLVALASVIKCDTYSYYPATS